MANIPATRELQDVASLRPARQIMPSPSFFLPMRPVLLFTALSIALLAPVASAQRAGESGGPLDSKSGRFQGTFASGPARPADTLALSAAAAWVAVSRAYEELGIPISVVDTETHVIGALRVLQRRPIVGERLSRVLECGTGSYGPNAERYAVKITVLTAVVALDATHAIVDTRVGGVAAPNGLSSSVTCTSTGVLEEKFASHLRKSVGG